MCYRKNLLADVMCLNMKNKFKGVKMKLPRLTRDFIMKKKFVFVLRSTTCFKVLYVEF